MPAITLSADDEEIIDIFVEEADEVLREIDRHLKTLGTRPKDRGALGELRRGFHTLKGSGRMAKAMDIGELAWKIENMLNRALEGAIQVNAPMIELLGAVRAVMPDLLIAFKQQRDSRMQDDLERLMGQADALSSGQAPRPAAPRPAAAPATDLTAIQSKLNEIQRQIQQSARRSDEALHRAEMAFQEARRFAGQIDALGANSQDRSRGMDLKPLTERLNALARDVLELREGAGADPVAAAAPPRDIQRLIDQRVRERLAASERSRQEFERQVAESLQSAASTRRMALWSLIIGILLSAGAATAAFMFLR